MHLNVALILNTALSLVRSFSAVFRKTSCMTKVSGAIVKSLHQRKGFCQQVAPHINTITADVRTFWTTEIIKSVEIAKIKIRWNALFRVSRLIIITAGKRSFQSRHSYLLLLTNMANGHGFYSELRWAWKWALDFQSRNALRFTSISLWFLTAAVSNFCF